MSFTERQAKGLARCLVEAGLERHAIGPNETIILDARTMHGLENTRATPMRYMVIITAAQEG